MTEIAQKTKNELLNDGRDKRKKTSTTAFNSSLGAPLAVLERHKELKAKNKMSGYERLFEEFNRGGVDLPTEEKEFFKDFRIRMMYYFFGSSDDKDAVQAAYKRLLTNPQKIIDEIEICGYHKNELKLLEKGAFDSRAYDMAQDDLLGVCGITNHYWLRKIYCENRIIDAITNDKVTQIVLPASGYVALGEMVARLYPDVQVYLSDLPPMMDARRYNTSKADFIAEFGAKPSNLHYDNVDLTMPKGEEQKNNSLSLQDALEAHPDFDKKAKTLYIYEGISMYLTKDHYRNLFRQMNAATPDNQVVIGHMEEGSIGERAFVGAEAYTDMVCPFNEVKQLFKEGGYDLVERRTPHEMKNGTTNWAKVIEDYNKNNSNKKATFAEIKKDFNTSGKRPLVDMNIVIDNYIASHSDAPSKEEILKGYYRYANKHCAYATFVSKGSGMNVNRSKLSTNDVFALKMAFKENQL